MRNLEVVRFPYGALRTPDYVTNHTLGSTSKSITPPSSAQVAIFSCDGNFYARYSTGAAVVPTTAADVTDGSACELNPTIRYIQGSTQINLVAPSSCSLTISWWKHP